MSVVTFFNNSRVETSQTTSMAAIATYLSIENNYKILLLNTKYNDETLKECFWPRNKEIKNRSVLESGVSGLVKAITSNKISPEIITNYTQTIFKDRLELLTSNEMLEEDYERQKKYIKNIIKIANKYYDLVFVDLEGDIEDDYIKEILQESDLTVTTTSQRIKFLEDFFKKKNKIGDKKNTLVLIGKYDRYSKYNLKNIKREGKMQEIYGVPYNTLFFEACNDGKVADFIVEYKNSKSTSLQAPIMEVVSEISEVIIKKLKELQMQI